MTEFERIARLSRRFGAPPPPARGIGDDCAVLPPSGAAMALKVDAAVEGVHFTRALCSIEQAAARAVEAALSDLAAAGASAAWGTEGGCGVLLALTLPPSLDDTDFDALIEGVACAAERAGTVVLGGNLASAPVLTITVTALGRIVGRSPGRGGARPGDAVYVTGTVGTAALGLAALKAGHGTDSAYEPFIERWRAPRARLAEGVAIAHRATAMVDVSDGLAQDAGHIAHASGCGIRLDADALPMLPAQRDLARALGCDPLTLALDGGEDYEICFSASDRPEPMGDGAGWTRIGEVVRERGVHVSDGGAVRTHHAHGWDHFRNGTG